MNHTSKKLGEAELEIMQVIWHSQNPVTSNYILKELQGLRGWQLSTLMTSLTRLEKKEFVICDRSTGSNLYTAIISEDDYKTRASRHFLEKLYNNSLKNMVATLYGSQALKVSDVEELREFLDQIEAEQSKTTYSKGEYLGEEGQ
ncbi:BlaI/MecI/CopY family transcriptional regulator [bacterium 1XD21-13]|nr:BlaI/MecI/CopY family transcriptional regulator [bacterium 1XD21-13]